MKKPKIPPSSGVIIWSGTKAEQEAMLSYWKSELTRLEAMRTDISQGDWGLENHIRDLKVKIADMEEQFESQLKAPGKAQNQGAAESQRVAHHQEQPQLSHWGGAS